MPITASHKPNPKLEPRVNYVSFNHDRSRFSVATSEGFRIYGCDSFTELHRQDLEGGEIGVAEMIIHEGRNMTALVKVGSTDIIIWDDLMRCPFQQISLASLAAEAVNHRPQRAFHPIQASDVVLAVKQVANVLMVVFDYKIYKLILGKPMVKHSFGTVANPKGICVASQTAYGKDGALMASPGHFTGLIIIERLPSDYVKVIRAYFTSTLACLALSADGQLVASSSVGATCVRVFHTHHGNELHKVNIAEDEVEIYSLALSPYAQWLAVSTDKGIVHVFGLNKIIPASPEPEDSFLACFKGLLRPSYTEYLEALFHFNRGVRNIVAFGPHENTVIIVGLDGSFYRCESDPVNGGKMILLEHHNFMKLKDD